MFGWFINASAWRSASKRAMTSRVSIPALMTLSATCRRTGWRCSANHTSPIPPAPTRSSRRYGPTWTDDAAPTPASGGVTQFWRGIPLAGGRCVHEALVVS